MAVASALGAAFDRAGWSARVAVGGWGLAVIPTMMVFGLLAGRWWRTALALGAAGWAALLLVDGVISPSQVVGAALFGLVNTAVGVAVHQAIRRLARCGRRMRPRHT